MRTLSNSLIWYLIGRYSSKQSPFLGPLLRALPLNDTTRQVLSLEHGELRAYLENLWSFNRDRRRLPAPDMAPGTTDSPRSAALPLDGDQDMYRIKTTAGLIRRFNQLPCTVDSRRRRADLLADLDHASTRVLVLGDDDLLSVELAKRGFAQVTVADCDRRLLGRIAAETKGLSTPPRIIEADFRQGGFSSGEPMQVVILDPPYSMAGAKAFLEIALQAVVKDRPARILLMINPDLFGASFSEISGLALKEGFRVGRQLKGFNAYPIGGAESVVLKGAWRVMMRLPPLRQDTSDKRLYFCSDCIELVRGH